MDCVDVGGETARPCVARALEGKCFRLFPWLFGGSPPFGRRTAAKNAGRRTNQHF